MPLSQKGGTSLQHRIQQAITEIANRHERGLLVTYKAAEELFEVPTSWARNHFGNLRGLNDYKDFDAVIIVGANTPPLQACEVIAGGLIGDEDIRIKFTGGVPHDEFRPYLEQPFESRVPVHPDPIVQALIEQSREAETIQALDRLRLIDRPKPAYVYLICSIPLPDLAVNQLTNLPELARNGSKETVLLDRFGDVLPLNAAWLFAKAPDMFSSEDSARRWAEKLLSSEASARRRAEKLEHDLLIGTYRTVGQAGRFPTKFLHRATGEDLRRKMEILVGPLSKFTQGNDNWPPFSIKSYIENGGQSKCMSDQSTGFIRSIIPAPCALLFMVTARLRPSRWWRFCCGLRPPD